MKKQFFGLSFILIFLRLQIYKTIAAIFWQSACYVLVKDNVVIFLNTRSLSFLDTRSLSL